VDHHRRVCSRAGDCNRCDDGCGVMNCYYCDEPLDEKHYQHAKITGRYQCTWKGDISCKKCFFLTPAEQRKFDAEARKLAKVKPKRVSMYEIPISFKPVLGKPRRVK
jgi:hypothetical protein